VLSSTNKGDIILDPCTGSSTTGLIAYLYDREFIGIDTEKEYLELSKKRFKDIFNKKEFYLKLF
jgi:site-specific DNA-methyltransferase (adenine-specific)